MLFINTANGAKHFAKNFKNEVRLHNNLSETSKKKAQSQINVAAPAINLENEIN